MLRCFILIVILTLSTAGIAQNIENVTLVKKIERDNPDYGRVTWNCYANDKGQLIAEKCITKGALYNYMIFYYPLSGNKEAEGICVNESFEDEWKIYYDAIVPRIKKIQNYYKGHSHGLYIEYDSLRSEVVTKGQFHLGKRNGKWTYYNKGTGKLYEIEHYGDDGKLSGPFYEYYLSGNQLAEGQYADGKRTGKWKYYFNAPGKLKSSIQYEKGERVGENIFYDSTTGLIKAKEIDKSPDQFTSVKYFTGTEKMKSVFEYTGDIKDGKVILYDSVSGNIETEGQYISNRKAGVWTFYYPSINRVKSVTDWGDGNGNGYGYKTFYDSLGFIISKGAFRENKEGEWIYYHKHSQQPEHIVFYKKGQANGPCTYYDSLGHKLADGEFKDNMRSANWKFYDDDGKTLWAERTYRNDKLNGLSIYYDSLTHAMVSKGNYENGKRNGVWEYYDAQTGVKKKKEKYIDGELEGDVIAYYEDGKISKRTTYKNGVLNGKTETFHADTKKLKYVENYKDGKLDGDVKAYYRSGEIKREEKYVQDSLLLSDCFDKKGNKIDCLPFFVRPAFMLDPIQYLKGMVVYPQEAIEKRIEGRVGVQFVIKANGKVSEVEIFESLGYGCDEEALRVIKEMPDWTPMYIDGESTDMGMVLPVIFKF